MAKVTFGGPKEPIGTILLEVFKKSVTPVIEKDAKAYAEQIAQRLREKIENNEFNFKAKYNEEYEKRKKKDPENISGGTNVPLYYTGQYHDSIGVERKGNTWIVGVTEQDTHYPVHGGKPVPMITVARTMEFGSPERNIPARPHWRPVLTEVRKEHNLIAKKWDKNMNKVAAEEFKKYLGSFKKTDFEYTWRTNK